jgi:hypothetical protein
VKELKLDKFVKDRDGNTMAKQTVNILLLCEERLKSLTLATFNKKVRQLNDGYVDEDAELDIDDMPATALLYEADMEA